MALDPSKTAASVPGLMKALKGIKGKARIAAAEKFMANRGAVSTQPSTGSGNTAPLSRGKQPPSRATPSVTPKPVSVARIKANVLRPAQTSHFQVHLQYPTTLRDMIGVSREKMILTCCDASLPGSQLMTTEQLNDRTGVTEKFVHRRMFDDRMDFTFYVDVENYLPIRLFESWIAYASGEGDANDLAKPNYDYRMRYPMHYIGEQGMEVTKFERDYNGRYLTYKFVNFFPISVNSMPVSYDTSSLLKCTVSMSYIRYYLSSMGGSEMGRTPERAMGNPNEYGTETSPKPLANSPNPAKQAQQNATASAIDDKMAAEFAKDKAMYGNTVPKGSFGITKKPPKSSSGRGAGRAAFNR